MRERVPGLDARLPLHRCRIATFHFHRWIAKGFLFHIYIPFITNDDDDDEAAEEVN